MRNIWRIFRSDWQRISASVVAVVVIMGLCLIPCLYAWFNIFSNWDPYGPDSTSNIRVAVTSEDEGYELLGLISFLTYGKDECRAWTIRKGTKAPQAAGKIHSDIERGFIRAETINFDEMMACGSVAAAKEKGLLRSEGKDYVVKDGDMIYFRFNV